MNAPLFLGPYTAAMRAALVFALLVVLLVLFVWNSSRQGSAAIAAGLPDTPGFAPGNSTSPQTAVAMAQLTYALQAAQVASADLSSAVTKFVGLPVLVCLGSKRTMKYTRAFEKHYNTHHEVTWVDMDPPDVNTALFNNNLAAAKKSLSDAVDLVNSVATAVGKLDPNKPGTVVAAADPTVGIDQKMAAHLSDMAVALSVISGAYDSWIAKYADSIKNSGAVFTNLPDGKPPTGCIPNVGVSALAQTLQTRVSSLSGAYRSLVGASMGLPPR